MKPGIHPRISFLVEEGYLYEPINLIYVEKSFMIVNEYSHLPSLV